MKKMSNCGGFRESLWKFIRVMKITILLITLSSALGWGMNSYSQNKRFTFDFRTATVKQVFDAIERNSEFIIFYQDQNIDLNRKVSVRGRSLSVSEVLDQLFEGSDNVYRINNRQIIVGKKPYHRSESVYRPRTLKEQNAEEPPKVLTQKVTGKVTGKKDGQPIPGVTVFVKGTTNGIVTDVDGKYSLSNVLPNATLVFSFIGTKKQEIKVDGQVVIDVALEDENTGLEQVVVVGYGTQKKVAVIGAVSSVQSKELMQSSSADLTNALSGKLAGLSALQNGGGQPGMDAATLYLRGAASLNDNSPLILIDGVPRSNIRTLDVNEVESVSVLKDASATAVFGVRGANGVLLITTKRGVEGKAQLSINVEQSFTSFTREPQRVHAVDYMKLRNLALTNDGLQPIYSDDVIAKYQNPLAGLDPKSSDYATQVKLRNYIYCDHDYYRELIKRYTPQTRVSVDVTGGTKNVSYYMNAGYLHQGGNLNADPKSVLGYDPSAFMDRFTFRSNLDYKITNSLSAFLNLGTYIEKVNMPYVGGMYGGDENWMMRDLIYQSTSLTPITPGPRTLSGYGVPGGLIVDPGYLDRSPYEVLNGRGFQNETRANLNSTLGATWDLSKAITPGLNIKGMISYDSYGGSGLYGSISSILALANLDYTNNALSYAYKQAIGSPLSISKDYWTQYNINLQGSANYNRRFGKHEVTGMLLFQRDFWDHGGEIPHNLLGMATRVQYNYDNRYFTEFDMGYNGSEQFAKGHRFGYFPAVSVGWVVTNEEFLKNSEVLTNLKIRSSYGKVGNDKLGDDRFLYLDNTQMGDGFLGSLGNRQQVNEALIGNPNLTWETSFKKNLGTDFSLFKNLSGTFDYFIEHRSNILLVRSSVPAFQGVDPGNVPRANMGIVYNHGYEIELNYNLPVNKDLSFTFRGNYAFSKNKVMACDEVRLDSTYTYRYKRTGFSLDQPFGYLIDWKDHGGYWVSQTEITSSQLAFGATSPRVGDFKYKDVNGDGVIDEKDQVPIGYSSKVPEVTYGFSLGTNYKDFDLTIFFQGVAKYSRTYAAQNVYEDICRGTYYDYHMNSWTLDRYLAGSKITYPALCSKASSSLTANDFFVMNCAFTRLKNVEFGYTLPKSGLKTLGINRLRIFVGGQNLYLWGHLRTKHLDPENNDPIGYPSTKMVNFGLNVTF